MNYIYSLTLQILFALFVLISSCKSDPKAPVNDLKVTKTNIKFDSRQIADDICKCMTPLIEASIELESLYKEDNPDKEKISKALNNLNLVAKKSEECSNTLEKTFPTLTDSQEKEMQSFLEKDCPKVSIMLKTIKEQILNIKQ